MADFCGPQHPVSNMSYLVCFLIRSNIYQVQICNVAENDLELKIFLSLPPKSRDSRSEPRLCGARDGTQGLMNARQVLYQPHLQLNRNLHSTTLDLYGDL